MKYLLPFFFLLGPLIGADAQEKPFLLYVGNERSGDVTVIDGTNDMVLGTFPVGKRPRGIQTAPDGRRIFVALSGSPPNGPGG
ncbi:MAG TPA: hypothetical protein VLO30_08365 [Chthoniobacterales bacterium]|nr:hypothetical protein [Chthoniobacterales bacterium]